MKISSSSCLEILKRNLTVRKSSSNALRLQPYTPPYLNLTQSQSRKNLTLKNSFTHSRCSRYHKTNHYFSLQYSFCAVCIHSNKAQNNGKERNETQKQVAEQDSVQRRSQSDFFTQLSIVFERLRYSFESQSAFLFIFSCSLFHLEF